MVACLWLADRHSHVRVPRLSITLVGLSDQLGKAVAFIALLLIVCQLECRAFVGGWLSLASRRPGGVLPLVRRAVVYILFIHPAAPRGATKQLCPYHKGTCLNAARRLAQGSMHLGHEIAKLRHGRLCWARIWGAAGAGDCCQLSPSRSV